MTGLGQYVTLLLVMAGQAHCAGSIGLAQEGTIRSIVRIVAAAAFNEVTTGTSV